MTGKRQAIAAASTPVLQHTHGTASRISRGHEPFHLGTSPNGNFKSARLTSTAWAAQFKDEERITAACGFMTEAIDVFLKQFSERTGISFKARPLPGVCRLIKLDAKSKSVARTIGQEGASLDSLSASYWLSVTYTAMLPDTLRGRLGIFYTPPSLSDRLMEMAAEAGVDWRTCRVLDPACGGGAFLAPAACKMVAALKGSSPATMIRSISNRLRGFEIDPFAAWMSQLFLEVALAEVCNAAKQTLPQLVTVADSLEQQPNGECFDLVIGNPPYGRLTLSPALRRRYSRSLYGHANLYGVFTDLALRWTAPSGVIAYVTPTSFLAGEYFKALRGLLAKEAPPVAIDIVAARKGVFENVQQETLLATYRRGGVPNTASVHHLAVTPEGQAKILQAGEFLLPPTASEPWLVPRLPQHQSLISRMAAMPTRLADWGYKVSTGPLVWNRHKKQLRSRPGRGAVPLIWAEAIAAPGHFIFRADKKNHEPYFKLCAGDDWLKIDKPCVLLQRTTAKEQARRLIAASLPASLIRRHGGVVIENHVNMVRPLNGHAHIKPTTVAAVLNSEVVDHAFRCISGSVAVSAFELEALPLPSILEMEQIEQLVSRGASQQEIDRHLRRVYMGEAL